MSACVLGADYSQHLGFPQQLVPPLGSYPPSCPTNKRYCYSRVAQEEKIEHRMAAEEVDQSPAEHPSTEGEQHQAHHVVNH